jgi:hypothetical protein
MLRTAIGLSLLALAMIGSTVPSGHLSLGERHEGTRLLAEHSSPDATLHLERIKGEHEVFCPGCLLQQRPARGFLLVDRSMARPAAVGSSMVGTRLVAFSRGPSARTSRGPPSC